jgi:hypothetical protein
MFWLRKLTLARSRNGRGAGGGDGDGDPFDFSKNYQPLNRGDLSLTCQQGDIAEDLSEAGKRTKASGTSGPTHAAIRKMHTKLGPGRAG